MTQQLDLFGSAPTAKAPPKSDTPMLLAMDPDYVKPEPLQLTPCGKRFEIKR